MGVGKRIRISFFVPRNSDTVRVGTSATPSEVDRGVVSAGAAAASFEGEGWKQGSLRARDFTRRLLQHDAAALVLGMRPCMPPRDFATQIDALVAGVWREGGRLREDSLCGQAGLLYLHRLLVQSWRTG